jgi:hypothetical protein
MNLKNLLESGLFADVYPKNLAKAEAIYWLTGNWRSNSISSHGLVVASYQRTVHHALRRAGTPVPWSQTGLAQLQGSAAPQLVKITKVQVG